MKNRAFETLVGLVVLLTATLFMYYFYQRTEAGIGRDYYQVLAKFDSVDGLSQGSEVRIGGIKVGTVFSQELDPETYKAKITLHIDKSVKIPLDSTAVVVGDGLLGGKFLNIQPGAEDRFFEDNGVIAYTQSSVNIETLIGKFIFGGAEDKKKDDK